VAVCLPWTDMDMVRLNRRAGLSLSLMDGSGMPKSLDSRPWERGRLIVRGQYCRASSKGAARRPDVPGHGEM